MTDLTLSTKNRYMSKRQLRLISVRVISTFLLAVIFSIGQGLAQDPGDTDIGDPDQPTGIPVDGGLGFLLAAGAVVGVRKIYKEKKSGNSKDDNSIISD